MLKRKIDTKKVVRRTIWFLVILLVGWFINLRWFKPFSVERFYERVFFEYSLAHPEFLTKHHAYEKYVFNDYARKLNDISSDKMTQDMDKLIRNWDMLKSYKFSSQTNEQKVSTKVLDFDWEMQVYMQQYDLLYCTFPINHVDGVHISFIDFMLNTHEINSLEDAENYLERLEKIPAKIKEVTYKFDDFRIPPAYILDKIIVQVESFVNADLKDNLIYKDFHQKVDKVRNLPQQARNELFYEIKVLVEEEITPIYRYLLEELENAKRRSISNAGVWQSDAGEIYYQDLLRHHLTRHNTRFLAVEDLSFEMMEEFTNISQSVRVLLDSIGYDQEDSMKFIMADLAKDTTTHFPDTPKGRKEFLSEFKALIKKNNNQMSHLFDVHVEKSLEVNEMVTHKTPYTSRFFYYPASLDDYRIARLFINTDSLHFIPKFMMPALVHLNVSPGTHFVKTVQHHQEHLPTFRRAIEFSAYIDGWSFYAQRYLKEEGYYEDLYEELGRQYLELLKATSALADYYIHQERFERIDAINFMIDNTGLPYMEAEAVVDRIIVNPGKAFAYWEGYQRIISLKALAKKHLGERFNIKSFHQTILKAGPVPLDVLEMVVKQYILELNPNADLTDNANNINIFD